MKALTATLPRHQLATAHTQPPQTHQQATSRWKSFNSKDIVLSDLQQNQYQLCGYSEVDASEHGWRYHIEHIENKSQQPTRTFDVTNLLASALHSDDLTHWQKQDVFGGHAARIQPRSAPLASLSCFA